LSQWLLERNADVTSVKGILERIQKEEFQVITKQVLEMKMSPKDALKTIKNGENQDKVKKTAFKLPEATSDSIVIFEDAEEEMMLHLQEKRIRPRYIFINLITAPLHKWMKMVRSIQMKSS